MLSLLTINVQAAALPRAKQLLAWLDSRNDDLVILTETSNGTGTRHLLHQCREAGLNVAHQPSTDGDRGCAIISRIPMTTRPDLTPSVTLPHRAVPVTPNTEPAITVVGLYVPSSDRAPAKLAKKKAFMASLLNDLRRMPQHQRAHLLIGGDYNVISRDHQPRYPNFLPFEYDFLEALTELGLSDTHQLRHPGQQVHSWFGRGGNAYRFDYFHTGSAFTAHVADCDYLEEPRQRQLSDHAAVSLALRIPAPPTPRRTPLSTAGALF